MAVQSAAYESPAAAYEYPQSAYEFPADAASVTDDSTPLLSPSFAAPSGSLSGKIVYTSPGHGYAWTGSTWTTGRGETNDMVEDLGTQDQMSFYAEYLLSAGATVVPMRPVGHQTNEVIVDNADAGFSTPVGSWSASTTGSPYFSTHGGNDTNHYMFAATSTTETAVARFTPNIPAAGFYPVYAWALDSSNRATDQIYRVNYSGGSVEVKVNHQYVGKGWVYLGTYYFESGTGGNVEVSNKSATTGKNVIADAIRFGNGMGDVNKGGGVSGKAREDEAAYYWIYRERGYTAPGTLVPMSNFDGGNSSDDDANVGAPSKYAAYMNAAPFGQSVYLGIHSNAGGGRGTLGLYNNESLFPGTATPNQLGWAQLVGKEVNDDMVALGSPPLEVAWYNRSTVTYARSDYAFGEIRTSATGDEFDATIIEVAFHDDASDAKLMLDPQARRAIARSLYQATVKYFNTYGGGSAAIMPESPTGVRATTDANGNVTLNWTAPATNASTGGSGAATGYKIYTSTNGYGFDNPVTLGNVTSYTFAGLPTDAVTYFKVVATNAGGESLQDDVLAAKPMVGRRAPILIVNGFDRDDRTLNDIQAYGSGSVERVRLRYNNTRDYAVRFAEAVEAYNPNLGIETVQNEDVINNVVNLANYQAVLWISGQESTNDESFSATEQSKVAAYINGGGKFFASGAEIGWDLDHLGSASDKSFYNSTLQAAYIADDAGTYNTSAVAGSIFAGAGTVSFDNGNSGTYNVQYPDVLAASAGSTAALNYSGGTGGIAALQYSSGNTRVVTMGFPFETITTAAKRNTIMAGVLGYFGSAVSLTTGTPDLLAASDTGTSNSDNLTRLNNAGGNTLQFTVPSVIKGAVVRLYSDGNLIAQTTAAATGSLTLTTNNTFTLGNGTHVITTTQTETGLTASAVSTSLTITVDAVAPTVSFAAVASPRSTFIQFEPVTFSESVTGFTLASLTLTRDGGANLLSGSQTIIGSGSAYTLFNLSPVTANAGTYLLSLTAGGSGITDAAGNALAVGASVGWVNNTVAGTSNADTISLVRNASNPAAVDVTVNGSTYTVGLAGLGQLIVNGVAGADSITLDLSAGTPVFDASAGLTIDADAASSLTMIGSAGDDSFVLSDTSGTLNGMSVTLVNTPAGLVVNGGTGNDALSLTNRSIAFAGDAAATTANLTLNLGAGASATFEATQHLAALNLSDDASAVLTPGGGKALVTDGLSVTGTASLDLADGDMTVNAAMTSDQMSQLLASGRVFSSTAVADIDHVTGLGYALASDLGLGSGAMLVKYTYLGDTDLDGRVTADDLARIDRGRAKGLGTWLWGDANYDGVVDGVDVTLAHAAFRDQGTVL